MMTRTAPAMTRTKTAERFHRVDTDNSAMFGNGESNSRATSVGRKNIAETNPVKQA